MVKIKSTSKYNDGIKLYKDKKKNENVIQSKKMYSEPIGTKIQTETIKGGGGRSFTNNPQNWMSKKANKPKEQNKLQTTTQKAQKEAKSYNDTVLNNRIDLFKQAQNSNVDNATKEMANIYLKVFEEEKNKRKNTPKEKNSLGVTIKNVAEDITYGLGNLVTGAVKGSANAVNIIGNIADDYSKRTMNLNNKLREEQGLAPKYSQEEINNGNILTRSTDKLIKASENIENTLAQKIENKNPISKKAIELSGAIGNMVPGIATSAIAPGAGTATFIASAAGGYRKDGLDRGMTEEQALKYGIIMGALEGGSEALSFGKLGKGIKSLSKGAIKEGLIDAGIGMLENATQEALIEPAGEYVSEKLGGTYDYSNMGKRMLESGIDGALVYLILGGIGAGYNKATEVGNKVSKGETVTQTEINEAIDEMKVDGMPIEEMQQKFNGTVKKIEKNAEMPTNQEKMTSINSPTIDLSNDGNINTSLENIENNEELMYNINRGDGNEENQRMGFDTSDDGKTGIYEEREQTQIERDTTEGYKKYEQSIKPIEQSKLTNEENSYILKYKNKYNKNIIMYDESNNKYGAGASIIDSSKIYISRELSNKFGMDRLMTHEVLESDIYHNALIKQMSKKVINEIMNDNNFDAQKNEFWSEQENEMPNDTLIAKDILCDAFAKKQNNIELDYDNMLSDDTNEIIDKFLNDYTEMKKYNIERELDNTSSFNLQENNHFGFPTNEELNKKVNEQIENESKILNLQKNTNNKIENYKKTKRNKFINKLVKELEVSKYANRELLNATTDEIINIINESGTLSEKNSQRLFDKLYKELIKIDDAYYNENKQLKNEIKKTKLYVDDSTKSSIVDFEDFRKRNLGNVTLTNNKENLPIDTFYQELNEIDSKLFPSNITNTADQLNRIIEIQNDIAKVEKNLEAYNDEFYGKEYKKWAKESFDKTIENLKNDIKQIKRVETEKNEDIENKKIARELSADDIQDLIKRKNKYEKLYKAQERKELLTKGDKIQLNRLLKGEITPNELSVDSNIEGIMNIFRVKKPYLEAKEIIDNSKIKRAELQENIISNTQLNNYDFDNINKMSKIRMNNNTPIRVIEKLFKNSETVEKIKNNFFMPIKHNEAERIRFLNKERNEIAQLGIKPGSKESKYTQIYGEKKFVDSKTGEEFSYSLNDLKRDFPENWQKIKKASEVIRSKYDTYLDKINEELNKNGYDSIPKREDYMRHFEEITNLFEIVGIPTKIDALPTDINGVTDTFVPGKNFFASALSRTGPKTSYDAIKGIDGYLEGASKLMYHTTDIQKLRTLEKYIRDTYGVTNGLNDIKNMSEEDRQLRLKQINDNHLSDFASWLKEYTNNIAGKKAMGDRGIEDWFGRRAYKVLNLAKKQVGSNLTGFNVNSALSNFISATQGLAKTNKQAFIKGTAETIANIFKKDNFINKSDFLTTRFGSDKLSKTLWEKASNAGQILMSATDYFTANQIVRSKYNEFIDKGYSEKEAIKKADAFADKLMAGRGLGDMPNIYNSKILGIFIQFQLEANNQISSIFYDTFKENYAQDSNSKLAKQNPKAYNTAVATFVLGQLFVYSWLFNKVDDELTGSEGAFDSIGTIEKAIKYFTSDDLETGEAVGKIVEDIANQLPYASLITGGGRIPTAEAIPNIYNAITGESSWSKEAWKLFNLVPPTGGGQARKTIQATKTLIDGGDYTTTKKGKKLRFSTGFDEMSDSEKIARTVQALTFGKYSLPNAQKYVDSGFKALSESQTEKYEEAIKNDITSSEFYVLLNATKNTESDKDAKTGKTIPLSKSKKQKKAIDEILKDKP